MIRKILASLVLVADVLLDAGYMHEEQIASSSGRKAIIAPHSLGIACQFGMGPRMQLEGPCADVHDARQLLLQNARLKSGDWRGKVNAMPENLRALCDLNIGLCGQFDEIGTQSFEKSSLTSCMRKRRC